MWLWLRRMIRRKTRPIPMTVAERWDRRLSLAYSLLAWNAGGFVLYMIFTGRSGWTKKQGSEGDEMQPSQYFANILNIKKAHVIHVSGLNKVKDYEIGTEESPLPETCESAAESSLK